MRKSLFSFVFLSTCLWANQGDLSYKLGYRTLNSIEDVEAFYPQSVEEVIERKNQMLEGMDEALAIICSKETPCLYKMMDTLDLLFGTMIYGKEAFYAVSNLNPNPEVRQAAEDAGTEVIKAFYKKIGTKEGFYEAFSRIPISKTTEAESFFLQKIQNQLQCLGLELQGEEKEHFQTLQEEITELSEKFRSNIRSSRKYLWVSIEELEGMDDTFVQTLETKAEKYKLTTDYPIYNPIITSCIVEATREKLYKLFTNRAKEKNEKILQALGTKRDELAQLLGYCSFAEMQLKPEMAKTPETVVSFLEEVKKVVEGKQRQDFCYFKENKPEEVTLYQEKFQPWDFSYALDKIKEKTYGLNIESLKTYFPLEHALSNLIKIYETFFSIHIEEVESNNLWHEEVRVVRVSDAETSKIYGFITLDLFPREGKYTHACDLPLLPSLQKKGKSYPALSSVVCNFSPAKEDLPSLLRLSDLDTFFHEFGHALHDMLGVTEHIITAGTNTCYDFVEMPSQILEEWLKDPLILQMCSSHYQTKEPLPLEIIKKAIDYKNSFQASSLMRQLHYANFSLRFHLGSQVNPYALWQHSLEEHYLETVSVENNYSYLAFGHLSEYGARYYGYLWSKVFALDVFETIKKEGVLNPLIGNKYKEQIIGKGGTADPNTYLENFLQRPPSTEALYRSLR